MALKRKVIYHEIAHYIFQEMDYDRRIEVFNLFLKKKKENMEYIRRYISKPWIRAKDPAMAKRIDRALEIFDKGDYLMMIEHHHVFLEIPDLKIVHPYCLVDEKEYFAMNLETYMTKPRLLKVKDLEMYRFLRRFEVER